MNEKIIIPYDCETCVKRDACHEQFEFKHVQDSFNDEFFKLAQRLTGHNLHYIADPGIRLFCKMRIGEDMVK